MISFVYVILSCLLSHSIATPTIKITSLDTTYIKGTTTNAKSSDKVALYMQTSVGTWYTKPTFSTARQSLESDRSFGSLKWTSHSNDKYATCVRAYLIASDVTPPRANGERFIPDFEFKAVDTRGLTGLSLGDFDSWAVKDSGAEKWAPGPNFFRPSLVTQRADGIEMRADATGSSEIVLLGADHHVHGYGTYELSFRIVSSGIDYRTVFGFFTYDHDPASSPHYRELDVELSYWGSSTPSADNSQFVVQPFTSSKRERFYLPAVRYGSGALDTDVVCRFEWLAAVVHFECVDNEHSQQWTYRSSTSVPEPGTELVRVNLWHYQGTYGGGESVVHVRNFTYTPVGGGSQNSQTATPTTRPTDRPTQRPTWRPTTPPSRPTWTTRSPTERPTWPTRSPIAPPTDRPVAPTPVPTTAVDPCDEIADSYSKQRVGGKCCMKLSGENRAGTCERACSGGSLYSSRRGARGCESLPGSVMCCVPRSDEEWWQWRQAGDEEVAADETALESPVLWLVVGGVVLCLVLVCAVALLIAYFMRSSRRSRAVHGDVVLPTPSVRASVRRSVSSTRASMMRSTRASSRMSTSRGSGRRSAIRAKPQFI